ncbi:unnamed protein product [Phytophthora fragariaefolia]|uniref:Unnamed protein product n=1 Tax=Phytophthora fragariaefolia TaxID=1490495 RepID=A0A9W7D1A4_9STRA|nr:unnamed protein product [Phytophthora fragariaefolia]
MLAATVTTARNGRAWVPAINSSDKPTKLPNKKELGTWIPVDNDMEIIAMNGELMTERVGQWLDTLGDGETPLDDESDIHVGDEEPSTRVLITMLLRVYPPIMLKRRRQAQMEDHIIEENVAKMLGAGVIEEGSGAWGFPVVLVRKKDGEVRFCFIYRAHNKVTKKDVYPLPRIDETLEAFGGALLLSTLDLRAGYWQTPDDREKTAFTTKKGLYRRYRGVHTRGFERHVIELANVLERLAQAGLTLKLKKCMFTAKSMEYLGHELSSEGVRPLQRLVAALQEFPRPADAVEAKRFVHLAGYYRRFVDGIGITKLLRKDAEWEWAEAQEVAFEKVKSVLTTKPLLIYPNFSLPFQLVTDASQVGLGACLTQDHGDGWKPVTFASKVNNVAESNYGITELECLAVMWAIKPSDRTYAEDAHDANDRNSDRAMAATAVGVQSEQGVVVPADTMVESMAANLKTYSQKRPNGDASEARQADEDGKTMALPLSTGGDVQREELSRHVDDDGHVAQESPLYTDVDGHKGINGSVVASGEAVAGGEPNGQGAAPAATAAVANTAGTKWRVRRRVVTAEATRPLIRAAKRRADELRQQEAEAVTIQKCHGGMQASAERVLRRDEGGEEPEAMVTATNADSDVNTDGNKRANHRVTATGEASAAVSTTVTTAAPHEPQQQATMRGDTMATEAAPGSTMATAGSTAADGPEATTSVAPTTVKPSSVAAKRPQLDGGEEREVESGRERGSQPRNSGDVRDSSDRPGSVHDGEALIDEQRRGVDDGDQQQGVREERERRREAEPTLQRTDGEIMNEQKKSRLVQHMLEEGEHRGMEVAESFGLATIKTSEGCRVILPPALWSTVLKECHDSVWAWHLRAPRGDVGDRWALDVAGPLPTTDDGERYVIAAVEYVTRYVVAVTVKRHTAEKVAAFLMRNIVLKFGAFREVLTGGGPELTGKAIEQLVGMLQAQQINPVPYSPQMVGFVERFHRTWKDCIATYMNDEPQRDWDVWVDFAVYAYTSGQHSTVVLSPNELMMGRRLKSPNDLLRRASATEAGKLTSYHRRLLVAMTTTLLMKAAADIEEQLEYEGEFQRQTNEEASREVAGTEAAPVRAAAGARPTKRARRSVASESGDGRQDEVVELRRRQRRNAAGQYVLAFERQSRGRLKLEKSCNSGHSANDPITSNDGGGRWRRACGGGRHQRRAHDGDSEDDDGDVRTAGPEAWHNDDGDDGRHRGGLGAGDEDEGPRGSGQAGEELHEEVGTNVLGDDLC